MPETSVPGPSATGPLPSEPAPLVEAALSGLSEVDVLPVGEQVAVFEGVHRALQDALATLDQV